MSNKHYIKGLKRRARRMGLGRVSAVNLHDYNQALRAQGRIHAAQQRQAAQKDPAKRILTEMERMAAQDKRRSEASTRRGK